MEITKDKNKCFKDWQDRGCFNGLGFTLIELLVVISIIGLLASVVLVSLNNARKKARITKRVVDLKQIQKALELYYNENNGYPVAQPNYWSECAGSSWGWVQKPKNQWIPGLVPAYVASLPADPQMNSSNSTSCYAYLSDGVNYSLLDHSILEFAAADYTLHPTLIDQARDGGSNCVVVDGSAPWSWKIATPGAVTACW